MKKVIKLNEQKLAKIVSLVMEAYNDYSDEDYIDLFLTTFRQWLSENVSEDIKKYPLSYLLNKYGGKFEDAIGVHTYDDSYERYSSYRLRNVARQMVQSGKYSLPSLKSDVKFTEKYAKPLELFMNRLDLPDWVTISFEENDPHLVEMKTNVDFKSMINQPNYQRFNRVDVENRLREYLENYLGVEFGNPIYGKVNLTTSPIVYDGAQEWMKNVLDKKLKKEIKAWLPNVIQAIKFSVYGGYTDMQVIFKSFYGYGRRHDALKKIREYLQEQGYNSEVLRVGS